MQETIPCTSTGSHGRGATANHGNTERRAGSQPFLARLFSLARGRTERLEASCERFFMYYEDTDLCWRMRLAGWEVRFCPEAVVWHDYRFDKGAAKWYRLRAQPAVVRALELLGV